MPTRAATGKKTKWWVAAGAVIAAAGGLSALGFSSPWESKAEAKTVHKSLSDEIHAVKYNVSEMHGEFTAVKDNQKIIIELLKKKDSP